MISTLLQGIDQSFGYSVFYRDWSYHSNEMMSLLVNSQEVCLPPVGIFNLSYGYLNVYLSLSVYIGPEKPQYKYVFFSLFLFSCFFTCGRFSWNLDVFILNCLLYLCVWFRQCALCVATLNKLWQWYWEIFGWCFSM